MSGTGIPSLPAAASERFFLSCVSEDRHGSIVTLLSALARLKPDPREEAAKRASSDREAAVSRLGSGRSRGRDVPAQARRNREVARLHLPLLPEAAPAAARLNETVPGGSVFTPGTVLTAVTLSMILIQGIASGTKETAE